MKFVGYIVYIVLQCTWGALQNVAGLILFLHHRSEPHDFYKGCIRTKWTSPDGISLGLFIFVAGEESVCERLSVHEYGHTFQSLILGPLYIIPGICSMVWARGKKCQQRRREKGISYYSFWTERWADHLGEKMTGLPSMGRQRGK